MIRIKEFRYYLDNLEPTVTTYYYSLTNAAIKWSKYNLPCKSKNNLLPYSLIITYAKNTKIQDTLTVFAMIVQQL